MINNQNTMTMLFIDTMNQKIDGALYCEARGFLESLVSSPGNAAIDGAIERSGNIESMLEDGLDEYILHSTIGEIDAP